MRLRVLFVAVALVVAPVGSLSQTQSDAVVQKDQNAPVGSEKNPVRVSSGVMAGNAIKQPKPIFTAGPRGDPDSAGSGTSVMRAVISPEGKVVRLEWISGRPGNREPVMDAVRQWTYKPYLLNGKAVWVQTTISIIVDFGL